MLRSPVGMTAASVAGPPSWADRVKGLPSQTGPSPVQVSTNPPQTTKDSSPCPDSTSKDGSAEPPRAITQQEQTSQDGEAIQTSDKWGSLCD